MVLHLTNKGSAILRHFHTGNIHKLPINITHLHATRFFKGLPNTLPNNLKHLTEIDQLIFLGKMNKTEPHTTDTQDE